MAQGRNTRTFSITTDLSAFEGLMRDVVDAAEEAVTPSALAGAKVIYQATLQAAPHGKKGHWFTGYNYKKTGAKYWFSAGNLRKSIYHAFSQDNSGKGYTTFHISWNYNKARYAYMVHNGTSKTTAIPFVTIAYESSAVAAQEAMAAKYLELLTAKGVLS